MPRIEDIPPDAIEWPPNRLRQERSPWEVDDLKADIEANGQDVPIIVWRDPATGRIYGVAGETRWLAMKAAEEKTIRAEFTDEADPLKRRSIEFRENNSRNAMTWRDSARAIATQHNMRVNANPRWTQQNTAEEMGVGQSYVSRCCDLYKCADKSEVWEEKNFDAAYNKLKLHEEIDLANRVNANLLHRVCDCRRGCCATAH
jgi:ParB/RepB/Spo0J family partition protein